MCFVWHRRIEDFVICQSGSTRYWYGNCGSVLLEVRKGGSLYGPEKNKTSWLLVNFYNKGPF